MDTNREVFKSRRQLRAEITRLSGLVEDQGRGIVNKSGAELQEIPSCPKAASKREDGVHKTKEQVLPTEGLHDVRLRGVRSFFRKHLEKTSLSSQDIEKIIIDEAKNFSEGRPIGKGLEELESLENNLHPNSEGSRGGKDLQGAYNKNADKVRLLGSLRTLQEYEDAVACDEQQERFQSPSHDIGASSVVEADAPTKKSNKKINKRTKKECFGIQEMLNTSLIGIDRYEALLEKYNEKIDRMTISSQGTNKRKDDEIAALKHNFSCMVIAKDNVVKEKEIMQAELEEVVAEKEQVIEKLKKSLEEEMNQAEIQRQKFMTEERNSARKFNKMKAIVATANEDLQLIQKRSESLELRTNELLSINESLRVQVADANEDRTRERDRNKRLRDKIEQLNNRNTEYLLKIETFKSQYSEVFENSRKLSDMDQQQKAQDDLLQRKEDEINRLAMDLQRSKMQEQAICIENKKMCRGLSDRLKDTAEQNDKLKAMVRDLNNTLAEVLRQEERRVFESRLLGKEYQDSESQTDMSFRFGTTEDSNETANEQMRKSRGPLSSKESEFSKDLREFGTLVHETVEFERREIRKFVDDMTMYANKLELRRMQQIQINKDKLYKIESENFLHTEMKLRMAVQEMENVHGELTDALAKYNASKQREKKARQKIEKLEKLLQEKNTATKHTSKDKKVLRTQAIQPTGKPYIRGPLPVLNEVPDDTRPSYTRYRKKGINSDPRMYTAVGKSNTEEPQTAGEVNLIKSAATENEIEEKAEGCLQVSARKPILVEEKRDGEKGRENDIREDDVDKDEAGRDEGESEAGRDEGESEAGSDEGESEADSEEDENMAESQHDSIADREHDTKPDIADKNKANIEEEGKADTEHESDTASEDQSKDIETDSDSEEEDEDEDSNNSRTEKIKRKKFGFSLIWKGFRSKKKITRDKNDRKKKEKTSDNSKLKDKKYAKKLKKKLKKEKKRKKNAEKKRKRKEKEKKKKAETRKRGSDKKDLQEGKNIKEKKKDESDKKENKKNKNKKEKNEEKKEKEKEKEEKKHKKVEKKKEKAEKKKEKVEKKEKEEKKKEKEEKKKEKIEKKDKEEKKKDKKEKEKEKVEKKDKEEKKKDKKEKEKEKEEKKDKEEKKKDKKEKEKEKVEKKDKEEKKKDKKEKEKEIEEKKDKEEKKKDKKEKEKEKVEKKDKEEKKKDKKEKEKEKVKKKDKEEKKKDKKEKEKEKEKEEKKKENVEKKKEEKKKDKEEKNKNKKETKKEKEQKKEKDKNKENKKENNDKKEQNIDINKVEKNEETNMEESQSIDTKCKEIQHDMFCVVRKQDTKDRSSNKKSVEKNKGNRISFKFKKIFGKKRKISVKDDVNGNQAEDDNDTPPEIDVQGTGSKVDENGLWGSRLSIGSVMDVGMEDNCDTQRSINDSVKTNEAGCISNSQSTITLADPIEVVDGIDDLSDSDDLEVTVVKEIDSAEAEKQSSNSAECVDSRNMLSIVVSSVDEITNTQSNEITEIDTGEEEYDRIREMTTEKRQTADDGKESSGIHESNQLELSSIVSEDLRDEDHNNNNVEEIQLFQCTPSQVHERESHVRINEWLNGEEPERLFKHTSRKFAVANAREAAYLGEVKTSQQDIAKLKKKSEDNVMTMQNEEHGSNSVEEIELIQSIPSQVKQDSQERINDWLNEAEPERLFKHTGRKFAVANAREAAYLGEVKTSQQDIEKLKKKSEDKAMTMQDAEHGSNSVEEIELIQSIPSQVKQDSQERINDWLVEAEPEKFFKHTGRKFAVANAREAAYLGEVKTSQQDIEKLKKKSDDKAMTMQDKEHDSNSVEEIELIQCIPNQVKQDSQERINNWLVEAEPERFFKHTKKNYEVVNVRGAAFKDEAKITEQKISKQRKQSEIERMILESNRESTMGKNNQSCKNVAVVSAKEIEEFNKSKKELMEKEATLRLLEKSIEKRKKEIEFFEESFQEIHEAEIESLKGKLSTADRMAKKKGDDILKYKNEIERMEKEIRDKKNREQGLKQKLFTFEEQDQILNSTREELYTLKETFEKSKSTIQGLKRELEVAKKNAPPGNYAAGNGDLKEMNVKLKYENEKLWKDVERMQEEMKSMKVTIDYLQTGDNDQNDFYEEEYSFDVPIEEDFTNNFLAVDDDPTLQQHPIEIEANLQGGKQEEVENGLETLASKAKDENDPFSASALLNKQLFAGRTGQGEESLKRELATRSRTAIKKENKKLAKKAKKNNRNLNIFAL